MRGFTECALYGWPMILSGVLTFGLLALATVALTRYVFFGSRSDPLAK